VRVAPWVCLLAVALAGCKSTPKDRPAPTASVAGNGGAPYWADSSAQRNPGTAAIKGGGTQTDPVSLPGNDPEVSGILAGKLVDGYGRAPGLAYVQVSLIRDGRAEAIADVETVSQGHFYIRGLQPGRTYKLVARSKQDGRVLVGEVQARPPETRLLIPLGEELAGATTPAIPAPPQVPKGKLANPPPPQPTAGASHAPPPEAPWDGKPTAGLGPPVSSRPPPISSPDQNVGADSSHEDRTGIPSPVTIAPIPPLKFAPTPSATTAPPSSASAACAVSGGRVVSLRLPDSDGRDWDFNQRHGRVILLDFWGTWCVPCLRAIPEVSRLNATYSAAGLEVIGVACEHGTAADNARRVRETRQRLGIGYRTVLADSATGQVIEQQFHVAAFPTLVLLDSDGAIIWRGGADQTRDLEAIIRRRLGY
jgi:thiol-disulfide isomerase/thioredoxin